MPGALGVIDLNNFNYDSELLAQTLDILSKGRTKSIYFSSGFLSVSSLEHSPLKGKRYYKEKNTFLCFVGDIIGYPKVPYKNIFETIKSKKFDNLNNYIGNYAIVYVNEKEKKIIIITDRRSQQPIYFQKFNSTFIFSTELSTFCRLENPAEFNEDWLFEYLFFNYPVSQNTFLKGVYKVPPASILEYDFQSRNIEITKYADIFYKKPNLMQGKDAFEYAAEIFREVIPQYYRGSNRIACALTDGWDARTILAFAPKIEDVASYTYGVPNCQDLKGAKRTARLADFLHIEILFDDNFVRKLPHYMLKTVFISSGLQGILRSTLTFVYESLTKCGCDFPLIVSGIALDHLFRGNHASPTPISSDIENIFRKGSIEFNHEFWSKMVGSKFPDFKEKILNNLRDLQNNFGRFLTTEHHLLFKLYFQGPEYFGGEIKIAQNFSTIRVPSWDPKMIDLAFSIKNSALSYSSFKEGKRSGKSVAELQSYILNKFSPKFAKIPVRNTRPDFVLKNKLSYKAYTLYRLLYNRIEGYRYGKKPILLENWDYWINECHRKFIDKLIFSGEARIQKHISKEFMDALQLKRNFYWIGKIATAEIILRLIENRWMNFDIISTKHHETNYKV
jgi:hypothetical protein